MHTCHAHLPSASVSAISERVARFDWPSLATDLDAQGYAVMHALLTPQACRALAATYGVDEVFRSRVVMARHGFGSGEYKYFAYPLPDLVATLRHALSPVGSHGKLLECRPRHRHALPG